MKNVVLGVGRKILQTYYIEKSYSTAYYFDITKLFYYIQEFYKISLHFKRNILKNVLIT